MEDKKFETLRQEVKEIKILFNEFVKGVGDSSQRNIEQNKQEEKLMKQVNELLELTYDDAMKQIEHQKTKYNYLLDFVSNVDDFEDIYNTVHKYCARYKLSFEEVDELTGLIGTTMNKTCESISKLKEIELVIR